MRLPRLALGLLLLLGGWGDRGLDWPYAGPMPDQPVGVPRTHDNSVMSGTRSFRPVEPMPWGEVNRRVAPGAQDAAPAEPKNGAPAAEPSPMPGHEHH
jgi:hypothetical protein